jgi:hypothetical protein
LTENAARTEKQSDKTQQRRNNAGLRLVAGVLNQRLNSLRTFLTDRTLDRFNESVLCRLAAERKPRYGDYNDEQRR